MVNGMSGIAGALTIMFLFWTITWFGRKLLTKTWTESNQQKILIISSAFIGSMAYAVIRFVLVFGGGSPNFMLTRRYLLRLYSGVF